MRYQLHVPMAVVRGGGRRLTRVVAAAAAASRRRMVSCLAGLAHGVQVSFELDAEVSVGAGAVERGAVGVLGPDRPVAGVMGGLRATGGVTHPDQGTVGCRGAGQLEAECPGRVGEPAVVRGPEVKDLGAFGQQVEDVTVTALRLGCRRRCCCRVELLVDAGEELGQVPGTRAGREDALLVVAELFQDQVEVPVAFVLLTSASNSA
ncbi:hypothetical protein ACFWDI_12085 [Streptomyces sp. NPDC060064]|uniref:hypothetical protein n=1 Tax=Streptomyces sp. NPDC060064 TaxID=3347049 RepID=UPI003691AD35